MFLSNSFQFRKEFEKYIRVLFLLLFGIPSLLILNTMEIHTTIQIWDLPLKKNWATVGFLHLHCDMAEMGFPGFFGRGFSLLFPISFRWQRCLRLEKGHYRGPGPLEYQKFGKTSLYYDIEISRWEKKERDGYHANSTRKYNTNDGPGLNYS